MSVIYFLLLVGVLVVIHELGHFAAAKLLDVKVLRFSIGYGRPLLRITLGETEYQLAAFPIGGYVRILGVEDAEETAAPSEQGGLAAASAVGARRSDSRRSFASRPLWQRLVIVFAGPFANLVLPVIIYFVLAAGQTMLPAAVIGDVLDHGPAARAGIEPGDRVLEINGKAIRYWEEIESTVHESPGQELRFQISRNGKVFERYVTPIADTVRDRRGGVSVQGRIGITRAPFIPIVGVIDGQSPAARAGLATGDLVISVDGQPVRTWSEVQRRLGKVARRTSIVYFRGTEIPGIPQIELLAAGFADLVPETQVDPVLNRRSYTGLEHAEMFVAHIDAPSPADSAGLKPGDLVLALDGKPVTRWMDLEQRLLEQPTKTFKLTWKRAVGGKTETTSAEFTQVPRKELDEYRHTVSRLVFGATNDVERGTGTMIAIDGRFGYALSKALERTTETVSLMASGTFQILAGDSPRDALGGPLSLYVFSTTSSHQGWETFMRLIALVSVNLGLINLLPIPMLDGGHLLVFGIETARRRPLSQRTRERVQLAGLIVIGLIMIIALSNDVIRLFL
ncbi:MAG: RIP metalloprotease RseP [Kofleriaceae bacterium]